VSADALETAVTGAMLRAVEVLEDHGVPLPPEYQDRADFMERLRDAIAALVSRLPVE
jgi:hypothetical protein